VTQPGDRSSPRGACREASAPGFSSVVGGPASRGHDVCDCRQRLQLRYADLTEDFEPLVQHLRLQVGPLGLQIGHPGGQERPSASHHRKGDCAATEQRADRSLGLVVVLELDRQPESHAEQEEARA